MKIGMAVLAPHATSSIWKRAARIAVAIAAFALAMAFARRASADALGDFDNATNVQFSNLGYTLSIPTKAPITQGTSTTCNSKPAGGPEIALSGDAFDLPTLPFPVTFQASAGASPDQVVLNVMAMPQQCFTIQVPNMQPADVYVQDLSGTLTLEVTDLPAPTVGPSCSGGPLQTYATFTQAAGATNALTAHLGNCNSTGNGASGFVVASTFSHFAISGSLSAPPPPQPQMAAVRDVRLQSASICPASASARTVSGWVDLTTAAPSGGFGVSLATSAGTIGAPALTVPAGARSAMFALALPPGFTGDVTVTAMGGGTSARTSSAVGGIACLARVPIFRLPPYLRQPGDPAKDPAMKNPVLQAAIALFVSPRARLAPAAVATPAPRTLAPALVAGH